MKVTPGQLVERVLYSVAFGTAIGLGVYWHLAWWRIALLVGLGALWGSRDR